MLFKAGKDFITGVTALLCIGLLFSYSIITTYSAHFSPSLRTY